MLSAGHLFRGARAAIATLLLGPLGLAVASSTVLVDTGGGDDASRLGYVAYNCCFPDDIGLFVTARFHLDEATTLARIETWMDWSSDGAGGSGPISLYVRAADGRGSAYDPSLGIVYDGVAGTFLYSTTQSFGESDGPAWMGFDAAVTLEAGDYWIHLNDAANDAFNGTLPGGAPRPLLGSSVQIASYFQYVSDAFSGGWIDRSGYGWGFRVTAVPEPASGWLLSMGLVPLAWRRWRRA